MDLQACESPFRSEGDRLRRGCQPPNVSTVPTGAVETYVAHWRESWGVWRSLFQKEEVIPNVEVHILHW
jgi:hypothetical protein